MEHALDKFAFCPACGSKMFHINNVKSKRCGACGFVYYLNPSAAVAAFILDDKERLLVVRRANDPCRGMLDLPGGFVDFGEDIETCLKREVLEETHLKVSTSQYFRSYPNKYLYSGFVVPTLDFFFLCKVENIGEACASDDAAELLWLPLDAIKVSDFAFSSIRSAIMDFLDNRSSVSL